MRTKTCGTAKVKRMRKMREKLPSQEPTPSSRSRKASKREAAEEDEEGGNTGVAKVRSEGSDTGRTVFFTDKY